MSLPQESSGNKESKTNSERKIDTFERLKIPSHLDDPSLPPGFLDDICLLPSFYQPETNELRWATHQNVRRSLFFSIFRDIKYVEFKRMQWFYSKGSFQIDSFEKSQEGFVDTFFEKYITKEKSRGRLIDCYLLRMDRFKTDQDEKPFQ